MTQCDVVLVYIREGVFGELEPIQGPVPMPKMSTEFSPKLPTPSRSSTHHTQITHGEQEKTEHNFSNPSRPPGITHSTSATEAMTVDTIVTPESASAPHTADSEETHQQPTNTDGASTTSVVIPESVDKSLHVEMAVGRDEAPPPALPSIGVFLSKTCTIQLIRCDFEQIKKTVELQTTQNKSELTAGDQKQEENTGTNSSHDMVGTSILNDEHNQPETHTSARKRTIIDYKKFLEEYTDEPPLPPKKKREVDLKWKHSKTRIAAEKYSRSKFFTKPTHLPRPVCRKKVKTDSPVALGSGEGQTENVNITPDSETTTVPATSHETQDAIEALLLLGNPPEQSLPGLEENEVLMPIAGPQQPNLEPLPDVPTEANPPNPSGAVPRPGTLLGVAIKTDQGDNPTATEDQPDDADDNDDTQMDDKNGKKKTFVTKEYGLKRRA